jgi:predicted ribosome quality control (RQC) complex YloA/Tae2 family protein
VKTPSFLELQTLIEWLNEELVASQLQEINATEDGIVISFYRFQQDPRMNFLVFDLDRLFPFMGLFENHPWPHMKKSKPVGLFLNAHAKNLIMKKIELVENQGRVVQISLGKDQQQTQIEYRLIPKQTNLIVRAFDEKNRKKSISWYPVSELVQNEVHNTASEGEEARSIPFLMQLWLNRRGRNSQNKSVKEGGGSSSVSPFDQWKKQKQKDQSKKTNALTAIQKQIDLFQTTPWSEVGEHLKNEGFKNLRPEWSVYVKFDQSVSINMQFCFEKAKSAQQKILGAKARLLVIQNEIEALNDLSEARFEKEMKALSDRKNKPPARKLEGRFRKLSFENSTLVAYMGKSAKDNIDLLRQSKAWDYWMHLKDYPSAHAILHRQKEQNISEADLVKCATWLVKEGLHEKKTQYGGRYGIVIAECRHVRPIKGDKLGRVTYNEAREILIAL